MQAERKKDIKADTPPGGNWMVTFADLLSLLLTFFVLLFSMSTIQLDSWKSVVDTMSDQFNPKRPQVDVTPHKTAEHLQQKPVAGLNLNYLKALLERQIKTEAGLQGTLVTRTRGQVVVSIPANLLFERKNTEVVTGAIRPLRRLAGTLVQIKNKLKVAGHTDAGPITNLRYRSNWELSLARARIVAGILADFGYTQSITVLGYADTGELPGDASSDKQQGLAERIDIVIIADRREKGPYDLF